MDYIVRKCDEIKKGTICVSLDGDDQYKTIIRSFPESNYVDSFAKFVSIYLSDNENLVVRNILLNDNDDEYELFVNVYYITKGVLKISDGVDELHIKMRKKDIENVDGFDLLERYVKEYNNSNTFELKYKELYTKMVTNNEKVEKLNSIIENHKPDEEIDLEGIMTFDEFKKYLDDNKEFYKSNLYFDNEYISKTFSRKQLAASYTLFITLVSFSAISFVTDEKIKQIVSVAGVAPILVNFAINLARHYTSSKMYDELLSADVRGRVKSKK